VSGDWRLYFGEVFFKVFHEYLVQTPAQLHGFLADDFEAPIQRFQIFFRDESARFESLLHVWILGYLAELLIQLGGPLGVIPSVAK
jgi:hypothetical protein